MICALGKRVGRTHSRLPFHATSCEGDSGGPLVADTPDGPRLIGAVSSGVFPCGLGGASIYARVANRLGFIRRTLGLPLGLNPAEVASAENRRQVRRKVWRRARLGLAAVLLAGMIVATTSDPALGAFPYTPPAGDPTDYKDLFLDPGQVPGDVGGDDWKYAATPEPGYPGDPLGIDSAAYAARTS